MELNGGHGLASQTRKFCPAHTPATHTTHASVARFSSARCTLLAPRRAAPLPSGAVASGPLGSRDTVYPTAY